MLHRSGRSSVECSTKTTDKNQAVEIAINFGRLERRAKGGGITTAQIRNCSTRSGKGNRRITGKKVAFPMHYNLSEQVRFISAFGTEGFLDAKTSRHLG